jgi:hypothetical protein
LKTADEKIKSETGKTDLIKSGIKRLLRRKLLAMTPVLSFGTDPVNFFPSQKS